MNAKVAVPVGVAILLMGLCAWVNGYWTDRWGASYADEQIKDYTRHLQQIPMSFGDWQGEDQIVDEEGKMQLKAAHIAYAVQRTYTNNKTKEKVSVFLACGPQRHLALHTPDQCFVAAGYDMAGESPLQFPIEIDPTNEKPEEAFFYTVRFHKEETAGSQYIRVFWSWNAGEGWEAPDYPKVRFAWKKALYKLYVMGDVQKVGDDLKDDPRVAFIREFIPVVNKSLDLPATTPGESSEPPAAQPAPASA